MTDPRKDGDTPLTDAPGSKTREAFEKAFRALFPAGGDHGPGSLKWDDEMPEKYLMRGTQLHWRMWQTAQNAALSPKNPTGDIEQ